MSNPWKTNAPESKPLPRSVHYRAPKRLKRGLDTWRKAKAWSLAQAAKKAT